MTLSRESNKTKYNELERVGKRPGSPIDEVTKCQRDAKGSSAVLHAELQRGAVGCRERDLV